jgi:hypothetical protein
MNTTTTPAARSCPCTNPPKSMPKRLSPSMRAAARITIEQWRAGNRGRNVDAGTAVAEILALFAA